MAFLIGPRRQAIGRAVAMDEAVAATINANANGHAIESLDGAAKPRQAAAMSLSK